jgi:citrate lyase gamma subunit
MKNLKSFNEFLDEAAAINNVVADKDVKVEETEDEKIEEAMRLSVSDEYGKQIWDTFQKEITTLVKKANMEIADGQSFEIIVGGFQDIFKELGNTNELKIIDAMSNE